MAHLGRRTLLFIIVLIATFLILFSYIFSNSRAGRITSDEEYVQSLQEASRGKQLAGQKPFPSQSTDSERIQQDQPSNLIEEIIFQLRALFTAR
ncbi:hypothetical protein IPM65_05805 [Candidatus Roizmanbacteria bacterium]|nr:MAG: hypothetical protein IPM65_05805 [Candidatus Roizmanbacteria bacterium]